MKRKIICLILFLLFLTGGEGQATDEIMDEQKSNFKISQFVKEAEKYSGVFFEDIDINEMLNDAISGEVDNSILYKKILNIFGEEVKTSLISLVSILVIVVIHSVLKAISDELKSSNVSQVIYYVQYILIVTVIMTNFTAIINMVKDSATNMVGFMNSLVPLLITLMIFTGSMVTSSVLEPVILLAINFLGNIINVVLIPLVLIITVFSIVSKVSDRIQIGKLSKILSSGVIWFLGISLTLFVSIISLEGTLSSSVDGITAKTTKAAVSTVIPVVGKILGDAVDTVLGCGLILKNAVGIVGVLIVIGICIMPILKLRCINNCI